MNRATIQSAALLAACECCDAPLGPDAHRVSADAAVCEPCRAEHYASPDDDDAHGAGCLCAECEDPAWDDPPTRDSYGDLDEVTT